MLRRQPDSHHEPQLWVFSSLHYSDRISGCNPETQARDVFFLIQNGYKLKKIQPVDMFPHTNHVETVVLMSRKDK